MLKARKTQKFFALDRRKTLTDELFSIDRTSGQYYIRAYPIAIVQDELSTEKKKKNSKLAEGCENGQPRVSYVSVVVCIDLRTRCVLCGCNDFAISFCFRWGDARGGIASLYSTNSNNRDRITPWCCENECRSLVIIKKSFTRIIIEFNQSADLTFFLGRWIRAREMWIFPLQRKTEKNVRFAKRGKKRCIAVKNKKKFHFLSLGVIF